MFKAESVKDAAFGCDWVGTPIPLQRCLIFIIATANKEFHLTAGKFVPVSNFTTKNVCICMIYVYVYERMQVRMCMYDCTYVLCMYACMYVRMYICMYVFIRPSYPRELKLYTIGFLITDYNINP